jgi:hypothetical protein
MAPVNMTPQLILVVGTLICVLKKIAIFFSPTSATKDQVKAVGEELIKFITFQMLTNMFRERDLYQIVF